MEIWRTTLEKKIYAKLPNSVEDPELLWSTVHVVMRFTVNYKVIIGYLLFLTFA